MKKHLLLFSFFPLFIFAQKVSEEKLNFPDILADVMISSQSSLRLSPEPYRPLDSMYVYDQLAEFVMQKVTYEYDASGYRIIRQIERDFSFGVELYQTHTSFVYGTYDWIERIDSIFEGGRYTSAMKYTRTYDEKNRLIDYRIYKKDYDGPWYPIRIYSADTFNEEGEIIVYMDTMVLENKSNIIHRWEVVESRPSSTSEVLDSYVKVEDDKWQLEFRYVKENIADPALWPVIRKRIMLQKDDDWTIVNERISYYSDHLTKMTESNMNGELIKSLTYEYFHNEGWASHTDVIEADNIPEIFVNNNSHTLRIDLKDQNKGDLRVVATSGRVIISQVINQSLDFISLSHVQPGYYIISVQTLKGRISQAAIIR